jgi:hypothetical protein
VRKGQDKCLRGGYLRIATLPRLHLFASGLVVVCMLQNGRTLMGRASSTEPLSSLKNRSGEEQQIDRPKDTEHGISGKYIHNAGTPVHVLRMEDRWLEVQKGVISGEHRPQFPLGTPWQPPKLSQDAYGAGLSCLSMRYSCAGSGAPGRSRAVVAQTCSERARCQCGGCFGP